MKNKIYHISMILALSLICVFASLGAVNATDEVNGNGIPDGTSGTNVSDPADPPAAAEPETSQTPEQPPESDPELQNPDLATPVITLDNDQITIDEIGEVRVEGTVSLDAVQEVGVFDADGNECGKVTVETTDAGTRFSILLTADMLHYGENGFTVKSLAKEGVIGESDAVILTIVIPKKNQTITAKSITFKEEKTISIKASVSTGLPLTYVSSKPSVASVNASGILTGKRGGTTKVTIHQAGTDKYNPASLTITVKVIPTRYRIAYDPAGGSGTMTEQAIRPGQKVKLKANKFKREGYKFVGWATASSRPVTTSRDVTKFKNVNMKHFQLGKVKYKNRVYVQNLAKVGKTVKLYAVWKGTGPAAAADWGRLVARDNKFGYNLFGGHLGKKYSKKHRAGKKKNKFGCYFCRTNNMSKKYCWRGGKTYVCMTFVNAAFAHGANCKTFWKKKKTCNVLYINGKANLAKVKRKCKALRLIGHPTVETAKKGDILVKNNWHVMMYGGKIGKKYYITEASTETGVSMTGYSAATMNKIFKSYTVFRLK